MKTTTLLTYLLTTTAASAATVPTRSPPTRVRDGAPLRLLHTLAPAPAIAASNLHAAAARADASTESTRGGAILPLGASDSGSGAGADSALSSVQGSFRVPEARMPTAGPTANISSVVYAASFWVGIDSAGRGGGDPSSLCGASLRAGVDTFWDGVVGGAQTPFAWYQFAPAQPFATGFEGFSVAEGDLVRFTLEVPSSSAGEESGSAGEYAVVAENFGPNAACAGGAAAPLQSVRAVLPAPAEGAAQLCGTEAAWMVEDFPLAGGPNIPLPLANFTSVTFGGAGVTLADGSERGVADAEVVDIRIEEQGGKLTSCEVVGGKKVKCDRVVGDE